MEMIKKKYSTFGTNNKGILQLDLTLFKDGDSFCMMDGDNLQSSEIVGFGDTKIDAIFDYVYQNENLPFGRNCVVICDEFNVIP